jgi:hypothetical protein
MKEDDIFNEFNRENITLVGSKSKNIDSMDYIHAIKCQRITHQKFQLKRQLANLFLSQI